MKYSFKNVSVVIEPSRLTVIHKHRKRIPEGEEVLIFRANSKSNITHVATGKTIAYPDRCSDHVAVNYLSWNPSASQLWHAILTDVIIPLSKMNKREKVFLLTLRISNTIHPI